MNTNKYLYQFSVNKEEEIEKTETSKNDKNEEVKITRKEIIDKKILIRLVKPTRKLFDDAELFYGVKLSEGIKAGLLTRALIAKRYQNDGGAMSEPEKEKYANLYVQLFREQNELQRIQLNLDNSTKEEKESKLGDLLVSMANIRQNLQEIELYQSSIFEQTAENRSRNQTIMWWALNISYISYDDGKTFSPIFGEGQYEERLANYDNLEEKGEEHLDVILKKLAYFISLWYMGKASTEKDFKELEDMFEASKSQQKKEIENEKIDKAGDRA
jgi:hypothetical protein